MRRGVSQGKGGEKCVKVGPKKVESWEDGGINSRTKIESSTSGSSLLLAIQFSVCSTLQNKKLMLWKKHNFEVAFSWF